MKALPVFFTALAEEDLDQNLILYRIEPMKIRVLRILNAAQDWTRYFGKTQLLPP